MIRTETILVGGRTLIKTWSDAGKYIIQSKTGIKYAEAIDVPNIYTYTESSEAIPVETEVENGKVERN